MKFLVSWIEKHKVVMEVLVEAKDEKEALIKFGDEDFTYEAKKIDTLETWDQEKVEISDFFEIGDRVTVFNGPDLYGVWGIIKGINVRSSVSRDNLYSIDLKVKDYVTDSILEKQKEPALHLSTSFIEFNSIHFNQLTKGWLGWIEIGGE